MLNNGDKLIVTKKVAPFLNEGDIVEVTNVTEDGVISFAFGDGFMHMGVMSGEECECHFEKMEEKAEEVKFHNITEDYILDIMENSEFDIFTSFDKCTILSCRLPNGFVITESSACVNAEDYDEKLGVDICFDKIEKKVWELEAYRLQQHIWESKSDCCCEDCIGCPCDEYCEEDDEDDFDECLSTDLDCDYCDDYKCPYNTNDSLFNTDEYNN